jgi:hypothetical protein
MIKHDQVARLVIDYLDEIGADLRGLSLNSLYQRKGKLHRRWRELRDLVDRLLYDKLGTLFHYQQQGKVRVFDVPLDGWGLVRLPGEARVEELLDLVVAAEHANCGQELGYAAQAAC